MPLIVVLMLICVITIILFVHNGVGRPSEIAELNKDIETNEEQISAATTTVNAGQSYIIPKDGLYKIELHGGKAPDVVIDSRTISGLRGSKVTGYVRLNAGTELSLTNNVGEGATNRNGYEGDPYGSGQVGYLNIDRLLERYCISGDLVLRLNLMDFWTFVSIVGILN